jgi:chromosome segregation ATPase
MGNMGSTWAVPDVPFEAASRLVLADLHQQIARHQAARGQDRTALQRKTNAHQVLRDRYTLLQHHHKQQGTVIERYRHAIQNGDARIQDFLAQLEALQEDNQRLQQKLVNANAVNCAFEKQLSQYRGVLQVQRKQLQFANTCVSEKDQVIHQLKK